MLTASALEANLSNIDRVRTARSQKELVRAGTAWATCNGFDHWVYGVGAPATPFLIGSFPEHWLRSACNEAGFVSPLLTMTGQSHVPLNWDVESDSDHFFPRLVTRQRLLQESMDCGIRCGVTVPFNVTDGRGNCVLTLVNGHAISHRARQRQEPLIIVFALYFQQALERVMGEQIFAPTQTSLVTRELECLRWASQSKTSREIADILSLAQATVDFHLSNAARKLGTRGRFQTIQEAFRLGILIDRRAPAASPSQGENVSSFPTRRGRGALREAN